MRGRKPNILEKATSLICLYSHGLFGKDVGAAQFTANAFGTVCKGNLVDVGEKTVMKGKELGEIGRQRRLFVPERNRKDVGVGGRWWFAG
jgi:hypothetical protein